MGWSWTPGDNYRRTGSTLVEPRSAPTFFAQFVCYFCVFTWFLLRCHLILRSFWHTFWAPFLWFSNAIAQRVPNSHFYGFLMLLFKEIPNPICRIFCCYCLKRSQIQLFMIFCCYCLKRSQIQLFMIFWCYCSKRSQIPFLWFSVVIVQIVPKSNFYDFLMLLFEEIPNPIFMIFWCYCLKRSQIQFLCFSDVIVQIVLKSHFYDFLTFLICYDIFISFFITHNSEIQFSCF